MKRHALIFVMGFLLVGLGACNSSEPAVEAAGDEGDVLTTADRDFMRKAGKSHLAEVDMARLARQQTANDDVEDFAEMLENDHQNALEDISAMITENNAGDITADAQDKEGVESMSKLTGAEFDRAYVNMMVEKH